MFLFENSKYKNCQSGSTRTQDVSSGAENPTRFTAPPNNLGRNNITLSKALPSYSINNNG